MSVVRVGATKRFSDNWENIFGGGKSSSKKTVEKPAKGKAAKKSPKKATKATGKKGAGGKKRKGK